VVGTASCDPTDVGDSNRRNKPDCDTGDDGPASVVRRRRVIEGEQP
jgi:hypothetical protein